MSDQQRNAKSIFWKALELDSDSDREAFLTTECGSDALLRARVEQLLAAAKRSDSFLDPPGSSEAGSDTNVLGSQIGPYTIREQVGEGGMGVVYVAEQTEPVQRKVAIKVIKPGMDTKEVIARFEAERQALAFMEHPNIARVLDAGATESGRSYFVMELVRGIPITEYCDQVKATPRERLELFRTVCDAVQHAHQKGIIHRDIKPSNVLVTQVSAKPVVKVIDFGLAKATSGQKLTDKTLYTGFMKLMGTPVYMSPEQAGTQRTRCRYTLGRLQSRRFCFTSCSPGQRRSTKPKFSSRPMTNSVVRSAKLRHPNPPLASAHSGMPNDQRLPSSVKSNRRQAATDVGWRS